MMRFAAFGLVIALAACKPPQPVADEAVEPIAHQFFEEVRTGADISADPHVAHELKNPTSEEELAEFRALMPTQPPVSVETLDLNVTTNSTGITTRLTQAYHYGERTLIAQTALFKSPSGHSPVIVGFRVTPQPAPGA